MQHPSRIYPHDYYEEREKQQEVDGLQNIYHFVFGTAIDGATAMTKTAAARENAQIHGFFEWRRVDQITPRSSVIPCTLRSSLDTAPRACSGRILRTSATCLSKFCWILATSFFISG